MRLLIDICMKRGICIKRGIYLFFAFKKFTPIPSLKRWVGKNCHKLPLLLARIFVSDIQGISSIY